MRFLFDIILCTYIIEECKHFRNESASRNVTLECLIKGKRKFNNKFSFRGKCRFSFRNTCLIFTFLSLLLQNERVHNNIFVSGNRITIMNINRHDGGHYQCLAENGMESPPVEAINVIVNCKNSFVNRMTHYSIFKCFFDE